jgi:hypothetical protein
VLQGCAGDPASDQVGKLLCRGGGDQQRRLVVGVDTPGRTQERDDLPTLQPRVLAARPVRKGAARS